jgi:uncharacterized protein (UPF0147 family)
MNPVDYIAASLIAAAYQSLILDDEYIAAIIKDTDVPAYFRRVAKFAAAPRTMDLYDQYYPEFDNHATFVMDAALDHLLTDPALPPEVRHLIEQIKAFREWESRVTKN